METPGFLVHSDHMESPTTITLRVHLLECRHVD